MEKHFDAHWFASEIRFKRGKKTFRVVCPEVGVSTATLCRIENKKFIPDLQTYYKICQWLKVPLEKYFVEKIEIPAGGFRAKKK